MEGGTLAHLVVCPYVKWFLWSGAGYSKEGLSYTRELGRVGYRHGLATMFGREG